MKSLGSTKAEIYKNWENYLPGPGYIVVGLLVGTGIFGWLHGRLIKHEKISRGVATYRYVTNLELSLIDEAIDRGWLQIECRPTHGIIGGQGGQGTISQYECPVIVLHQATGKELAGG